MIVSKTSWHYRVQRYSGDALNEEWTPPHDLCRYFWRLLFAPVLCLAALLARGVDTMLPDTRDVGWLFVAWATTWVVGTLLAVVCLLVPAADLDGNWHALAHILLCGFPFIIVGAGAFMAAAVSITFVGIGLHRLARRVLHRAPGESPIFVERAKAWKQGVCPIIEYRNGGAR